jgi:hypothetical protein
MADEDKFMLTLSTTGIKHSLNGNQKLYFMTKRIDIKIGTQRKIKLGCHYHDYMSR